MDWDRLITVEQMEAATNELLETGKKVGADSWQQRVKNQTPRGALGVMRQGPMEQMRQQVPASPKPQCGV